MNPLKLIEALEIVQRPTTAVQVFPVALVCGFTPLHLEPLLGAHLRLRLPSRRIEIETGLFGDLTGNLARAAAGAADAIVIIAEWPDFDARLDFAVWARGRRITLPRFLLKLRPDASNLSARSAKPQIGRR